VREFVIVTAWNRPDFLHACLSRLMKADDGQVWYVLSLDRGHDKKVREVASSFMRTIGRTTLLTPRHGYRGNSFNTLTGMKFALKQGADRVYLVEDDILVGSDFFSFHRDAHRLVPENLSVSACRNQFFAAGEDPLPEEDKVYAHLSYQSLGVSLSRESLSLVVPHITHAYLSNPVNYCKKNFPGSGINPANAEQDGLIHRIGERDGLPTVYPCAPRAYHAGFTGYHRAGKRLWGTVEQRSAQLLGMSSDDLNGRAESYKDHVAIDLDARRVPVSRVGDPSFG
jgi:hypothetical protein